jgi:hypothetical protein
VNDDDERVLLAKEHPTERVRKTELTKRQLEGYKWPSLEASLERTRILINGLFTLITPTSVMQKLCEGTTLREGVFLGSSCGSERFAA